MFSFFKGGLNQLDQILMEEELVTQTSHRPIEWFYMNREVRETSIKFQSSNIRENAGIIRS